MSEYLYKVSAPRAEVTFFPSTFWHTADWESSTTRYRKGYIEDRVLYVGDFDEINIHLLPRVRTVRVRAEDADFSVLYECGVECSPDKTAYIFAPSSRKKEVESFHPTIFKFDARGFKRVRKGEFVSWKPQKAISYETISIDEAVKRWNIQIHYTNDLDALIANITQNKIYHDVQSA